MAHEQNAPARFAPSDLSLDPARGIPLYVQLGNIFRYKIRSGAWPENLRLDKFETLAAQFKVARITVRQAVALLVQEGLLTSRRGRGTIVCSPPPARHLAERTGAGARPVPQQEVKIKIVYKAKVDQLPPEFAADFDSPGPYVEISKVHVMGGIAFGMMRIFVAEDVFNQFPRRALEQSTTLSLVSEHAPEMARYIRQTITVEPADFILSEHLSYPLGSPVAKIMRHSYGDDGRLAYVGISWYRGDSFELEMTLPSALLRPDPSVRSLMAPRVRLGRVE